MRRRSDFHYNKPLGFRLRTYIQAALQLWQQCNEVNIAMKLGGQHEKLDDWAILCIGLHVYRLSEFAIQIKANIYMYILYKCRDNMTMTNRIIGPTDSGYIRPDLNGKEDKN